MLVVISLFVLFFFLCTINFFLFYLVRLTIDIYNDSLMLTLSAWNWPSRSLAHMKADHVLAAVSDESWDIHLQPFVPPNSALHYRDPVVYHDTLDVVASLEYEKLTAKINDGVPLHVVCISCRLLR